MRNTRHTVLFDASDPLSVTARALADAGLGYELIAERTGLTIGRVSYRLKKARRLEGVKKGVGYSRMYRHGQTFSARLMINQIMPRVKDRIRRTLPGKIAHPVPEVAEAA